MKPRFHDSIKYKEYYTRNHEYCLRKARGGRFKQKYWPHLTTKQALAEWDRLFAEQNGKCSMCKTEKSILDVDHCHKTGKVRSLLCNDCNTALARVKEDLTRVLNLAEYILKHND